MPIPNDLIVDLIFKRFFNNSRFTQDSPIYPDVWLDFFKNSTAINTYRADLILTPHRKSSASALFKILSERLNEYARINDTSDPDWALASSGESVVACLTLDELIHVALPLTNWYHEYIAGDHLENEERDWLSELVGAIYSDTENMTGISPDVRTGFREIFKRLFPESFKKNRSKELQKNEPVALFSISRNRDATFTLEASVPATKADAGRRLFSIDGSQLAWAVLDTGIDARHPAFRKMDQQKSKPFAKALGAKADPRSNNTRIVASYDFTKFRDLLAEIGAGKSKSKKLKEILRTTANAEDQLLSDKDVDVFLSEIENDLRGGRLLDWTILGPLLRIPHNAKEYVPPVHPHGTHVAGIIGAHDIDETVSKNLIGMCPGIDLYDIRVLDQSGKGKEFNILAALQFVRWMNMQSDDMAIHGINLSFSMIHEVASYACGQTPACMMCDRLVSDGVVVVASAGNLGQAMFQAAEGGLSQGFRVVNITDPGNAESIITVGSTHRNRPHSYGVSYFSSKGPTGDGRSKPDLVAPGEKIVSCVSKDSVQRMDGTSMAAPHVSGAAALLMAKHRELIGRPRKIKEILCKTATDLGREKYFQGCGMVDVLRAIQSV